MWKCKAGIFSNGTVGMKPAMAWNLICQTSKETAMEMLGCDYDSFKEFCKLVDRKLTIPVRYRWWR